jgi:predicted anti-sigma-YlaC factor YlaD
MSHLTADQLIDALEAAADAEACRHLDSCDACRAQFAELARVMQLACDLRVPEPSPLFWQHFSVRVRSAVEAEGDPVRRWPRWLRLPVLAPLAGLAMVIALLVVSLPRPIHPRPADLAEAGGDAPSNEDGWTVVADAVGHLDWDTAVEAGLTVEPGAVDLAVMDLSADERRALTALLEAELRAKS